MTCTTLQPQFMAGLIINRTEMSHGVKSSRERERGKIKKTCRVMEECVVISRQVKSNNTSLYFMERAFMPLFLMFYTQAT